MSTLRRLGHTFRICWSTHLYFLLGVALLVSVVTLVQVAGEADTIAIYRVTFLLEVILPLVAMAAVGHVLVVDLEAGFAEVLDTYPSSRIGLGQERLLIGAGYLGIIMLPLIELVCLVTPVDRFHAWLAFLPPTLFLAGLALVTATLFSNWTVGLVAGSMYWLMEMGTMGSISKSLFLFRSSFARVPVELLTNRWWLSGIGLALIASALVRYGGKGCRSMRSLFLQW